LSIASQVAHTLVTVRPLHIVGLGFGAVAALPAAACIEAPGPVTETPDPGAPDAGALEPMRGFSWVSEARIAGMPQPGVRRALDQDLSFLEGQGIDLLITLTERPLDAEALGRHRIATLHIPVRDYTAPTMEQLDIYVAAVEAAMAEGKAVGTHCGAGLGRTGTFLAGLLGASGRDADTAIAEVRALRPGSIETRAQEEAVHDYARLLVDRDLHSGDPLQK
jgi:atypical dual specificity phosphatase